MRHCPYFVILLCLVASHPGAANEKPLQRIGFGSCVHQEDPQPIWEPILALKPDLFLLVGDNIYHDVHRSKEAKTWTVEQKYQLQASVPGFKKLKEMCPVLGTWDDHDYGLNDAGEEYAHKKETQQALLDFFGVAKDSPRREREGVYHAEVFGPPEKSVQVILLDTRYFRSLLKKRERQIPGVGPYVANKDPNATMLGEAQWKWLEEQLNVPAKVRLLVSSVQVVPEDHGWEKWMNYPHERERLFKLIRDTKAGGVIALSGDRHHGELSMMDANIGYPLYDLTSSGLSMAFQKWRLQEVNRHRVATMNYGNNFGMIAIDWERKDPIVSLQIRDEVGDIILQQKVPLSVLQPGKLKIRDRTPVKLNGSPLNADLVNELMGKEVTLEMTVQATGAAKKGDLVFLNSTPDRGAENFTVVLNEKALGGSKAAAIRKQYEGKRIRVEGTLSMFREQPQIMVSDRKRIAFVVE